MKIQFVRNKEDDNHCLQASLMMALGAIKHSISWQEIDNLSSYEPGYYTWVSAVIAPFSKIVPGIKLISSMDYKTFSEQGEAFLKEIWPSDWFILQQKHSSPHFKKEQVATKEATDMGLIQKATCKLVDLESLLKDNFLIILVDSGILSGKDYSSAHYVFVYDHNKKYFEVHDPGLPGYKKWKIDKNLFISAFRGDVVVIPKKYKLYSLVDCCPT